MSKITKTIVAMALCLPLVSSATLSAGDMVSVNFWGQFNGADVGRVTGSFGVVGDGNTVNSAWQNIINPAAFTGTLTSKDGVDTTLSITGFVLKVLDVILVAQHTVKLLCEHL